MAFLLASTTGFAGAAAAAPRSFSEDDVTAAVTRVIEARSKSGAFKIEDAATGADLSLVADGVRVIRGLPGYGWFPNVNFHDAAEPKKKYALDFWLKPAGEELKLMAVRVHKAPQRDGASWMTLTRAPLPWWWLPTIERSSSVAGLHAWQVMGTIHSRIIEAKSDYDLLPRGSDGEPLELDLIDVLQPVGKSRTDGRYFACVAFRAPDTRLATYSVGYWLDPKSGSLTPGRVRPQSLDEAGANKAAAEPRCDIGGATFDIVD